MPLMTKELSKEIMTRSRLRNNCLYYVLNLIYVSYNYLNYLFILYFMVYKTKKQMCFSFKKCSKKYGNLNEKKVTNNKQC